MHAAVIVFPGSNCDRDLAVALERAGARVSMVWHKDTELPAGIDLVAIPGGFSFGDYLRCGAIAANSPICRSVVAHAERGGHVLGICNGFQVLTETGLLPGALMRNAGIKFICRRSELRVETTDSPYTAGYAQGQVIDIPVAHHDGNYTAGPDLVARLARRRSHRVHLLRQPQRLGRRHRRHPQREPPGSGHDAAPRARRRGGPRRHRRRGAVRGAGGADGGGLT